MVWNRARIVVVMIKLSSYTIGPGLDDAVKSLEKLLFVR